MIAYCYASDVYQLPIMIARICNFYKPSQLRFGAMVPDAVLAALGHGTFIPQRNGSHIRYCIYVTDVIALYARIAECLSTCRETPDRTTFNVSTNGPRTVRKVIEYIFNKCNNFRTSNVILDQMRSARTIGEITVQYIDFGVVKRDLGWAPTMSFKASVAQTIG